MGNPILDDGKVIFRRVGISCRYAGLPEYHTHSVFDIFCTFPP